MYVFRFESVLDLIKFYSDNDKLGTKLKYAPLKEYFLKKEKDGFTTYPVYHHLSAVDDKGYLMPNAGKDDGKPEVMKWFNRVCPA